MSSANDPALHDTPAHRLSALLEPAARRRLLIGLLPLLVAAVLAVPQYLGLFRPVDALFFDFITLREAGTRPGVVILSRDSTGGLAGAEANAAIARAALKQGAKRIVFARDPGFAPHAEGFAEGKIVAARAVERVPGTAHWRFSGPAPAQGIASAAQVIAAAERGLHRSQLGWLPAAEGQLPVLETAATGSEPSDRYMLRLSRRQNLPRITDSQLIGGELGAGVLAGQILLVETSAKPAGTRVVTARDPAAKAMSLSEFNAAAIQTLASGRAVHEVPPLLAVLLLLAAAFLPVAAYLRADPKRIMPLLLVTSLAVIVSGAVLLLVGGNLLLPLTALVLAQPLTALAVLYRAELDEDRNLRRFVTQTINLSSRQALLKDLGRLPSFLAQSAPLLGVSRYLLIEQHRGGKLDLLAAAGASLDELKASPRQRKAMFASAESADRPIDAAELVPGWDGVVKLAALGPAQGRTYWLYEFAPDRAVPTALGTAVAIVADYRAIQQLRANLSAGSSGGGEPQPTDQWAGGAVKLISDQGELVGAGLDQLETAVMVFHPIGYPVKANAAMAELCQSAGLALSDSTMSEVIIALTDLEPDKVGAIIKDLLLNGKEMRVNCRKFDSKVRMVRAAAMDRDSEGNCGALVVEVIDISEPLSLADLRLSVSQLLDVSIRNDLEAVGFALALAQTPGLAEPLRTKALEQIEQAAFRANSRLEEMAPLLRAMEPGLISQAYPIDVRSEIAGAAERVRERASELGVELDAKIPGIGGHAIADPKLLAEMIEAMLMLVIADTPRGEAVKLELREDRQRSHVTVSGGIGMAFERLYAALGAGETLGPGPFRPIVRGISASLGWGAQVSYSSGIGKGYRFTIDLRRIG